MIPVWAQTSNGRLLRLRRAHQCELMAWNKRTERKGGCARWAQAYGRLRQAQRIIVSQLPATPRRRTW
jgi:hypothetical protein